MWWLTTLALAADPATLVFTEAEVWPGSHLSAASVYPVDAPADLAPPGALSSVEQADGRVVVVRLRAHQPVLEQHLAPPGTDPGMTALLGPDQALVWVPLPGPRGVPELLDRVDVLVERAPGDWCFAAQAVRVVGLEDVDRRLFTEPGPGPWTAVWLAFPEPIPAVPVEAIRLAIRNPIDRDPVVGNGCFEVLR